MDDYVLWAIAREVLEEELTSRRPEVIVRVGGFHPPSDSRQPVRLCAYAMPRDRQRLHETLTYRVLEIERARPSDQFSDRLRLRTVAREAEVLAHEMAREIEVRMAA